MKKMERDLPHSIKCLRAIAGYEGGIDILCEKLGMSRAAYNAWLLKCSISKQHIVALSRMARERFTVEDLIGKYDQQISK